MVKINRFERIIASVGLGNFVNYYEDYLRLHLKKDDLTQDDKKELAKRLLHDNLDATSLQAQFTRINAAIELFDNAWNVNALEKAINSTHHKITNDIKIKAKRLLLIER